MADRTSDSSDQYTGSGKSAGTGNVSELQPLLERIEQSNKEKEAVAAMRREFSANVSHELKTPLTSISGYAEIMKDGLKRPERYAAFSEKIIRKQAV